MNFSIEQLLAFVTVYDQLSFSKAAVKLNKHRTTISQVITNLEDQLAVSLFERVGRSVKPTEDGHHLYHYAKQTIEQARTFDKVALSLSYGGLENITFAYSSVIPHQILVDIRKKLRRDFPMMRVNFLVRNKKTLNKAFRVVSIILDWSTCMTVVEYTVLMPPFRPYRIFSFRPKKWRVFYFSKRRCTFSAKKCEAVCLKILH